MDTEEPEVLNSDVSSWKTNSEHNKLSPKHQTPDDKAAITRELFKPSLETSAEHNNLLNSSIVFDSSAAHVTDSMTLPLPSESLTAPDMKVIKPIPAPRSPRNRKLPPVTTTVRKLPALPAASTAQTIDITDGPSAKEVTASKDSSKKSLDSWDVITVSAKPQPHTNSEKFGDILDVRKSHMLKEMNQTQEKKVDEFAQSPIVPEDDTLGNLIPDNQTIRQADRVTDLPGNLQEKYNVADSDANEKLPLRSATKSSVQNSSPVMKPKKQESPIASAHLQSPCAESVPISTDHIVIESDKASAELEKLTPEDKKKTEFGKTYTLGVRSDTKSQQKSGLPIPDQPSRPKSPKQELTASPGKTKTKSYLPKMDPVAPESKIPSVRLTRHHTSTRQVMPAVTRDDIATTSSRTRHRTVKKGRRSRSAPRCSDAVLINPVSDMKYLTSEPPSKAQSTSPSQRASSLYAEPLTSAGGDMYDPTSDAYQVSWSLCFPQLW